MSVVLETGRAVRTDGYHDECVRRGVAPIDTVPDAQYWLGVPMTTGEMVIGMLALHRPTRAFAEADERLLSSIGHLAALALRSARLFEERTRAYGELASAQDQLVRTEKLRALGEMASGVAHDFNNLLASILGRAQLTLQRLQTRSFASGCRSSSVPRSTARRPCAGCKSSRGPVATSRSWRSISTRSCAALSRSPSRAGARRRAAGGWTSTRGRRSGLPTVAGDAAELREAMTNLILNAVDAMPTGGTLTLTTRVENNLIVVTVADTGVGSPRPFAARSSIRSSRRRGRRGPGSDCR